MHVLCSINDIPEGDSKNFEVAETNLFAVKKDGQIYVYHNNCPHLNVNLEWNPDTFLDADKEFIQCSTHGALFMINSGQCIQGPCLGKQLQAVDVNINDHQVMIKL